MRFMPTSITVAPGLTQSARDQLRARRRRRPARRRARQTAARSRVREWQTVTVAFAASSSCATGLPTRSSGRRRPPRRPRARPRRGRAAPSRPAGASHGDAARRRRPCGRAGPALTGVSPSTSLPGRSRRATRVRIEVRRAAAAGRGSRRRRGSAFELGDQRRAARPRTSSAGSSWWIERDPDLLARLVLVADVDLGGGVVADEHGRQPGRPPSGARPRRDDLAATRSRTSAATALPSMIVGAHRAPSGSARSRPSACARSRRRRSARPRRRPARRRSRRPRRSVAWTTSSPTVSSRAAARARARSAPAPALPSARPEPPPLARRRAVGVRARSARRQLVEEARGQLRSARAEQAARCARRSGRGAARARVMPT